MTIRPQSLRNEVEMKRNGGRARIQTGVTGSSGSCEFWKNSVFSPKPSTLVSLRSSSKERRGHGCTSCWCSDAPPVALSLVRLHFFFLDNGTQVVMVKQGCPWRPQVLSLSLRLGRHAAGLLRMPLSTDSQIQDFFFIFFLPLVRVTFALTFSVRVGGESPAGKYQLVSGLGRVTVQGFN